MKSQRLTKREDAKFASEWYAKTKTPEEKKALEDTLRAPNVIIERLKEMIQARYDACQSPADYNEQSWAYRQAHKNGRLEAFEEIFKLLP